MKKLVIIFIIILLIGCSKKHTQYDAQHQDTVDDYAEAERVEEEGLSSEHGKEGSTFGSSGDGTIEEDDLESESIESDSFEPEHSVVSDDSSGYGDTAGTGGGSPFKSIYFEYDSYEIRSDSVTTLESIVSWMKKNTTKKIVIQGHCDERGTNEYNLALGDKRASAANDYLVISGISSNRITVVSYGEERPVCQVKNESCYQKNRRAYVVLLQ